jgi:polyhydroxyalkanoate depolymerase
MPESVLSRMPIMTNNLESIALTVETCEKMLDSGAQWLSLGCDTLGSLQAMGAASVTRFLSGIGCNTKNPVYRFADIQQQNLKRCGDILQNLLLNNLEQVQQEKRAELAFLKLFTEQKSVQDWSVAYDDSNVILDLPSLRVIDISTPVEHCIRNYTLVFAPRAGHHSNIAERVALYLRDRGLTRMAVVEQKCAQDIPLYIDGKRHREDFTSQVQQYTQVMAHVLQLTGKPAHLVAICQPGPLLISSLILNPHLGRTFGSAGSPMHTEAQKGFLTDFARLMGASYIDGLMALFGRSVEADKPGRGREFYDGTLQILGFYYLGMDQHVRNFRRLLTDLKTGNTPSAERQKVFYDWYNTAHHFPDGFIRDTYQKIFVRNELIHGKLMINENNVDIRNYPGSVPIWALGGKADPIVPPLQAIGHMNVIKSVPDTKKLNLICEGGHMALFRSKKILSSHYKQITEFILQHSDKTDT